MTKLFEKCKENEHEFHPLMPYVVSNRSNPLLDKVRETCKNCPAYRERELNPEEVRKIHEFRRTLTEREYAI